MPSWNSMWVAWLEGRVGALWRQRVWRRFMAGVIFFLAFSGLIGINYLPENLDVKEGQIASKDILAPKSVVFQDQLATEALRKAAATRIPPAYSVDVNVEQTVINNMTAVLGKVRQVQKNSQLSEKQKIDQLKAGLPFVLKDTQARQFLQYSDETLILIGESSSQLIHQVMVEGVAKEKLKETQEKLTKTIDDLPVRRDQRESIRLLTVNFLQPNKVFNEIETHQHIQAARDAVVPVTQTILQGQKIVSKGEPITKAQLQRLEALGLLRDRGNWSIVLGISLLVMLSMAVVVGYIRQFKPELYDKDSHVVLLGLIVFIVLLVARGILAINFAGRPELSDIIGYLVPMAAGGMLITVLLDSYLAIVVSIMVNTWLGVLTGFEIRFTLVGVITSLIAIYSVSHLSQRSDLAKAGLLNVGATAAGTVLSIGLVTGMDLSLIFWGMLMGLGNGILSAVITGGVLPYLESTFGITSAVRLLELSNPNNGLLKRLLVEAPGTYHHSIIVGNLAEAAADSIGANALLVRTGAYYHDIGKTKRPYFFVENQMTGGSPHDKIAPSLSTLIITSHVRDGVELARDKKLPEPLIDIIEQHHGTSLVSYFYHLAKETDKHESVLEETYRYDGPKPQTREAALVMLADSVEAAVRAMKQPSMGDMEGQVRELIKKKLDDGQLDECDITLRDLHTIANAFMKVLAGIYHHRIEYPDQVLTEIERRRLKDAHLPN
ncbi:MAG TPA: HDIG domain-containing protein [Bacillota bacterium]|nr:HDIG domain-containing protein [Bacillota bacterium]